MYDLVFLILHYKHNEMTEKCVEYIFNNSDTSNYHIVIVDNASPIESYDRLISVYSNKDRITVIRNVDNTGFARGNNVGFKHIKDNMPSKYIVMINSDLFLEDKQIYEKLEKEYVNSGFAVAGPMVRTPDGSIKSNPFITSVPSIDWLNFMIRRRKLEMFWARFGLYEKVCPFIRRNLKKFNLFQPPECIEITRHPHLEVDDSISRQKTYNVGLNGCALVFSRKYIDLFDGLDGRTFLGGEELLLYIRALASGLKTAYIPEIEVLHIEGGSRDKEIGNKKRTPDTFRYSLKSYIFARESLIQYKKKTGRELHEDLVGKGLVKPVYSVPKS